MPCHSDGRTSGARRGERHDRGQRREHGERSDDTGRPVGGLGCAEPCAHAERGSEQGEAERGDGDLERHRGAGQAQRRRRQRVEGDR